MDPHINICYKYIERREFLNMSYHFLDFNLGGGFLGIKNNALMGCMSHKAENKTGKNQHSVKNLIGCLIIFIIFFQSNFSQRNSESVACQSSQHILTWFSFCHFYCCYS